MRISAWLMKGRGYGSCQNSKFGMCSYPATFATTHDSALLTISSLLWPPYGIGQAIIFLPFGFFFLSVYLLFSSPNLRRPRLDVCHTCRHGVCHGELSINRSGQAVGLVT